MAPRRLRNESEKTPNTTTETLHAVEERLKYLVASSPGVIYCRRPSTEFGATFISENTVTQLGYEAHEFIEDPNFWADRIHPEDKPQVLAGLSGLLKKGSLTHEYRFLHKDGNYRWIHDQSRLIKDWGGNPIEIVGFWMDITERKKMEEALRESEDKYRAIFETAGTAIVIIEEDATISLANSEVEKVFGCSKRQLEGKRWTEFVRQEDLERMEEYHRLRRIDPDAAPRHYEFGFIDREGNLRDISLTIAMIPGTKKSVASLHDITEQKRIEKALSESEKHYRLLAENLRDVIWTVNMNLRFTYISPSVEHLLRGYSVQEVMSGGIEEILPPASYELVKKTFTETLIREKTEERSPFSSQTIELELKCKDGSTVWTETKMNFLRSPDGRPVGILGVTRDISERKRAEGVLRESEEKLHFLSSRLLTAQETERKRISMELHDELGQALVGLKLGLSSIQKKLRKDQKVLQDECESVKESIEQVIHSIRRLSQGLSPYLLETLGFTAALRRLIEDTVKYRKMEISAEVIDIDQFLSPERQLIVYRIFQEALSNIRRYAEATRISVAIRKENDLFLFMVEDNGKGFDVKRAMLRDINERGLGLAAMEERVRMLGGTFQIQSEVGKGTRIHFTVPINGGEFEKTSLPHPIGR